MPCKALAACDHPQAWHAGPWPRDSPPSRLASKGFGRASIAHLARALTARLVTSKRAEVKSTVHADDRLGVRSLRVEGDGGSGGGSGSLLHLRRQLGQLEGGRARAEDSEEEEAEHYYCVWRRATV